MGSHTGEAWPELPYDAFAPSAHLLHMTCQLAGKLRLLTPYEPHWANVPLEVTARGLSTGPLPEGAGAFAVELDLVEHVLRVITSWGPSDGFALGPASVSEVYDRFIAALRAVGVTALVDPMPQEVADPVPCDQDHAPRPYDARLVTAWWRILLRSQAVMQRYRARFLGVTPPIGLMWGTLDLRDVRYLGPVLPSSPEQGYIFRNAMNRAQAECGWWHGTPAYPRAAYYAFTHPKPDGIARAALPAGGWDAGLGEFLLDYDDVRRADDPEATLLAFLESTYAAGAERCGWPADLVTSGVPEPGGAA